MTRTEGIQVLFFIMNFFHYVASGSASVISLYDISITSFNVDLNNHGEFCIETFFVILE